jgi:hypothetical protein
MDWTGTLTKYGWSTEVAGAEPFHPLSWQAQQARAAGESVARISSTVGTAVQYGEVKCSFTVSIECVQSEATINLAGEAAFLKALELTNDGARFLGIDELKGPSG